MAFDRVHHAGGVERGAVRDAGADGGVRRREKAQVPAGLLGRLAGGRRDRGVLPPRALGADLQRLRAPDERDHAGADRHRRAGGPSPWPTWSCCASPTTARACRSGWRGCRSPLSVALVAVMAHSYTMAASPAVGLGLWILYVPRQRLRVGPATFAFPPWPQRRPQVSPPSAQPAPGVPASLIAALVGAAINALAALAFADLPPALRRLLRRRRLLLRPDASERGHGRRCGDGRRPGPCCGWARSPSALSSRSRRPSWAGAPATGGSGAPVAIIAALAEPSVMRVAFYNLGLQRVHVLLGWLRRAAGPGARPLARPRERVRRPSAWVRRGGEPSGRIVPRETSAAKKNGCSPWKHRGSALPHPSDPKSLRARSVPKPSKRRIALEGGFEIPGVLRHSGKIDTL